MKIPDTIKHAPRWTWYVIGGVGIGTLAVRLYENRTGSDAITADSGSDPSASVDPTVLSAQGYGAAGNYSPSPIIVSAPGTDYPVDQSGTGLADLQNLTWQGVGGVIGTLSDIANSQQGVLLAQNDQISQLASGGSAPTPADISQAIVSAVTKLAPPAVIAAPPASSKPKSTTTTTKTCKALFPNNPHHDAKRGGPSEHSCYHEECVKGKGGNKKIHRIFKNGYDDRTDKDCK